jgi:hypothetical protein
MKNESILIAITKTDGSLSIMNLATIARGNILPSGAVWFNDASGWWYRDPTKEVIEKEIAQVAPDVASWRQIENAEIQERDREFRNAWRDTGTIIEPDLNVAKVLKANMIRKKRKVALAELDAQWMKAVGQKDKVAEASIETQRQKWRDAPADPRIEAAKTVDDLKAITYDS